MNISLAVTIPDDVKYSIAAAIERMTPVAEETLWTERDQLQLPIVTIGEVAPAFVPHITSAVSKVCTLTPAFPIEVCNFGFYGTKRFPHNIWAAIKCSEIITNLYEEIWAGMKTFGFEKPDAEFHPHIVLGICKAGIRNHTLTATLNEDDKCDFGSWNVKKVTLYDCKVSKRGKVYRKLNQIPLIG